MPITQARLNDVLMAAEHYREKCRSIRALIADLVSKVAAGKISQGDCIRHIQISVQLMGDYDRVDELLAIERTRYYLTERKNTRDRNKANKEYLEHQSSLNIIEIETEAARIAAIAKQIDEEDDIQIDDDGLPPLSDEELARVERIKRGEFD